jgi:hypothetical protein
MDLTAANSGCSSSKALALPLYIIPLNAPASQIIQRRTAQRLKKTKN